MTETAKERIYREELESIKLDLLEARPISPNNIRKVLAKAEKLPVTTDKLSVEKLQEQLNSKVKALTEIRANIEEHNQIYDLSTDTALLLEGIDGIAFEALETEEGNE